MKRLACLPLIALAAACGGSDGDYLIVTVNAQAAVHDMATIKVTLSNAGSERIEELPLGSKSFPATFSVSAPGRTGDLRIDIDALDATGLLVGRGSAMTTFESPSTTVLLDTADFVVNTEYAKDQLLSNYFEANGFQVAATADGTWTVTHSDSCDQPCNVFGRRFDKDGRPMLSQAAAGTNAFAVSTKLTSFWSTPTVAANTSTTLFVWNNDMYPPPQTPATGQPGYSIDCRAFDMNGAPSTNQITVTTDFLANLTSVTPLSNGNFAITWDSRPTEAGALEIRGAIVNPSCMIQGAAKAVSTTANPRGSHVASSGNNILYAWTALNEVYVRSATLQNTLAGATDTRIVAKTATEQVEHVRVAPLPGGNFAVFVRWALITGSTGPGRIEMFRTNNAGAVQGPPVVVTTRSGTDFNSSESFGVAAHSDGSIFVVWHSCEANGDDSGCGVFGRLVSPAGMPVGEDINLATTTKDDQTRPAAVALPGTPASFAVAWTDKSQVAPDTAGTGVRARIVYPSSGGGGM
jgi:hypothetical protein